MVHSRESQTFSDAVAWFLLVLVVGLVFILFLLVWPKVKKFYLSKHKTPTSGTTTAKGVCFPKNFLYINQV